MVHYNLNNKHFKNSKNLTPEQFKQIFKASSPFEFYLNKKFSKEIKICADLERVINEEKKNWDESAGEYSSPLLTLFNVIKMTLQKKVDEEYLAIKNKVKEKQIK